MKTSVLVENGATSVLFIPEDEYEKNILGTIRKGTPSVTVVEVAKVPTSFNMNPFDQSPKIDKMMIHVEAVEVAPEPESPLTFQWWGDPEGLAKAIRDGLDPEVFKMFKEEVRKLKPKIK